MHGEGENHTQKKLKKNGYRFHVELRYLITTTITNKPKLKMMMEVEIVETNNNFPNKMYPVNN